MVNCGAPGANDAAPLSGKTGPYPLIRNGEKPDMTRTASATRDRTFALGPEKVRATILAAGTETDGRHGLPGGRGA
jgi:hypothetical protein